MEKKLLDKVRLWANEYCEENELFLVDVCAGAGRISVFADSMANITIQECAKLSRFLQAKMEESTDALNDYNLDVSSPGMSNSLKLPIQYRKRIGKTLNFLIKDGLDFEGKVMEVTDEGITVEQLIPANKKKKEEEKIIKHEFKYDQITKAIIPLKFKK